MCACVCARLRVVWLVNKVFSFVCVCLCVHVGCGRQCICSCVVFYVSAMVWRSVMSVRLCDFARGHRCECAIVCVCSSGPVSFDQVWSSLAWSCSSGLVWSRPLGSGIVRWVGSGLVWSGVAPCVCIHRCSCADCGTVHFRLKRAFSVRVPACSSILCAGSRLTAERQIVLWRPFPLGGRACGGRALAPLEGQERLHRGPFLPHEPARSANSERRVLDEARPLGAR